MIADRCIERGDPVRWRVTRLALPALLAGFGSIGASPAIAQTRLTSLDDLRRALATGDFITLVPAAGESVTGRLTRIGPDDLDVRVADKHTRQVRGPRDVTIALDAIRSLDRPRDPVRNGAAIGAGIGAGVGGALFVHALVVDRNEVDEWGPAYLGATAVSVGIGALIGWAIDAAHSKPHIIFDASSDRRAKVNVRPVCSRGPGIALVVSFAP